MYIIVLPFTIIVMSYDIFGNDGNYRITVYRYSWISKIPKTKLALFTIVIYYPIL